MTRTTRRRPQHEDTVDLLREHDIRPSAQRVAVAEVVLGATDHPSAEDVRSRVRDRLPMVSRATVYNTLHVLVEAGLVREWSLGGRRRVYDANTDDHHHFIDEDTGAIHDLPWDALQVRGVKDLDGLRAEEWHVVVRGRTTD